MRRPSRGGREPALFKVAEEETDGPVHEASKEEEATAGGEAEAEVEQKIADEEVAE